jgi:glycine cleavage system H protein
MRKAMTVRYSEDHEYIRIEGTTGFVGITDYAQGQLGDIVFVELPAAGKALKKGDEAAVVESVKAASEIYSPVAGTVAAVNDKLTADPALVNQDPMGEGWLFQLDLADPAELDALMDEAAYAEFTK